MRKKLYILLLLLGVGPLLSAQIMIRGKVTDTSGAPLSGVTVLIGGTTTGTMTGVEGEYSLSAKGPGELEFSCLGLTTEKRTFKKADNVINVTMQEDKLFLSEVVVVGYGSQSKANITGSVDQMKGAELLKGPSTNVTSMLAGRITGVSSVQESGQPGADQANIRIRGSIYGVSYIVDGVPRSIDGIDPSEIETISVLKDAAAASVYGLSGAGGVIIVTTKKGALGKAQISYKGSVGGSFNANFPEFLDGPEYAYYYNKALELDGLPPVFSKENVQSMINGTDGWGNTNWIKETFGTGLNHQHNISVQGGNESVRYFASLGYMGQKGNVEGFTYKRYNARVNLEAKIAKYLVFNMGVSAQIGDKRQPGLSAGGSWSAGGAADSMPWYSIAEQAVYSHPYLPIKVGDQWAGTLEAHNNVYNPIAAIKDSGAYKTLTTSVQTTASLQWNLPWVEGLSLKATGSYDAIFQESKNLSTPYKMLCEKPVQTLGETEKLYTNVTVDPRGLKVNKLTQGLGKTAQLVGQLSANYEHKFARHDVKGMVLMEVRDYKYNNFTAKGKDLQFIELPELSQVVQGDTDSGKAVAGSSSHSRVAGLVARLNYGYDERYLIELACRYDGSYKFSGNVKGKRWGFFPSASIGWRISNEKFFAPAKAVLNDLKIRASIGEVGNDNITPFSFLSTLGTVNYPVILNGKPVQGLQTTSVSNPRLGWERTRSANAGFDAIFWNKLLGVSFDGFYTYTYGILSRSTSYPDSMGGYYPTYINNNIIDNRGVELTLSHDNQVGDFYYGIKLNISWARAKYLKYQDSYGTLSYQKRTGSLYNSVLTLIAEGLFQSEEEIDHAAWYNNIRPSLGDIKYRDVDGDGVIHAEKDRTFSGRSNRPELTGGLNIYLGYKGLDLSLMFTGAAMSDVALTGVYYNYVQDHTPFTRIFKGGANSPKYLAENSWTPEHTNAQYPRLSVSRSNDTNSLTSTFWYRDGKYLRLKTAQIGYAFPEKWMKKIGVSKLRLFVEGSNLFTLSGLPEGIDPEAPGVNCGYYPQQRTVMGGVNITF